MLNVFISLCTATILLLSACPVFATTLSDSLVKPGQPPMVPGTVPVLLPAYKSP